MRRRAIAPLFVALFCMLGAACVAGVMLQSNKPSKHAAIGRQYLFVGDIGLNAVVVLDAKYRRIRSITQGIDVPAALWFDRRGDLYVANSPAFIDRSCTNAGVAEYAPGASSPSVVYSAGLTCPAAVTTDARGNVYVLDLTLTVNVYRHGRDVVVRRLRMPRPLRHTAYGLGTIASDGQGNVFTTMTALYYKSRFFKCYTAIFEYSGGTGAARHINDGEGCYSPGLAFDAASNLIMSNSGGDQVLCDGGIVTYAPPYTGNPAPFVSGNCTPFHLALSLDGTKLFVTSRTVSDRFDVLVYSYPGRALLTTLGADNGLEAPYAVAVGSHP